MPYFFATEHSGELVFIRGEDARHLAGPLRARAGELIEVVEPEGLLLSVRIVSVSSREVSGRVEASRPHRPEPGSELWLAIAMLPAAGLEHTLSRCTELGVAGFRLVQAERSVARGAKPARWGTICREAAMLAGRTRIPIVEGPMSLREAFDPATAWLLTRDAPRRLFELASSSAPGGGSPTTLAVGPEGGWTDAEVGLAGERLAGLGPRNLRADTAALAAAATWFAARGDL